MSNTYESNYIDSLASATRNSECSIDSKETDISSFFEELNEFTKGLKARNGRLFFIGNGASAAFSNHMALDWSKNGKIFATSLSDSALLTALSNDFNYEDAFTEWLKINDCSENDLIVTVSSSGNSSNIVSALTYAKESNIPSIAFSGLKPDNKSRQLSKFSAYVPAKTYGAVECIHQILLHLWLDKYMSIYEWDRDNYQNMNNNEFTL